MTAASILSERSAGVTVKFPDGDVLLVEWASSSQSSRYHSIWLRHSCHCKECKHPQSGEKTVDATTLPDKLTISKAEVKGKNLEICWKEEADHGGIVPLDFLFRHDYSQVSLNRTDIALRVTPYRQDGIPSIRYEEFRQPGSSDGLYRFLSGVADHGVILVEGVPPGENTVIKLAETIAAVQGTVYGQTFDLFSIPQPIDMACSSAELDLHSDLINYESAPGIQILHCLRFDECVKGGETIILDAFGVAEEFRLAHPQAFRDLARIPANFQSIQCQRDNPIFMTYKRPHITLNHRNEITGVFWSPPVEGPLTVPEEDVEPYYRAYRLFAEALKASLLLKTFRLQPGQAMVANNRRMLHGRKAFTLNGGTRMLKGCYVNIDEFKSHFRCLCYAKGVDRVPTRVGNQCWA